MLRGIGSAFSNASLKTRLFQLILPNVVVWVISYMMV